MVSQLEINKTYDKYKNKINMSFTEVVIWKSNPAGFKKGIPRGNLFINIRLLRKPKLKWDVRDVDDAKTIIKRIVELKKQKKGKKIAGKLTKRDIKMLNNGYSPFKA